MISFSRILCLVATTLSACSPTAGGELFADASDATSGDAPSPEVAGPPPGVETQITSSPLDELFPDVGEDAIVFVRPKVTAKRAANPPDCFQCFGCGGCSWQMVLHRPSTGVETVLGDEVAPGSAPHVMGDLVVWLRTYSSDVVLYDLVKDTSHVANFGNWGYLNAAPLVRQDRLYWYGYSYQSGQSGVLSAPVSSSGGKPDLEFSANCQDMYVDLNGALGVFARRQPFVMDDERFAWSEWNNVDQRLVIRVRTIATGETVTIGGESGWDLVSPALGGGRLAWKSYERSKGCGGAACDLKLFAQATNGEALLLTDEDSRPSRYARLAFSGSDVLWVDYRGGPYEVYARDLAKPTAPARRVTSDAAVLGAATAPVAFGRRIVWMDHRAGSWDLWKKDL